MPSGPANAAGRAKAAAPGGPAIGADPRRVDLRSPPNEIEVRWRPSRHARRLLTLAAAGLLLAVLTSSPALAGAGRARRCCCSARAAPARSAPRPAGSGSASA